LKKIPYDDPDWFSDNKSPIFTAGPQPQNSLLQDNDLGGAVACAAAPRDTPVIEKNWFHIDFGAAAGKFPNPAL
jgi:hypothetical protein